MLDVVNEKQELCALDDLSDLVNMNDNVPDSIERVEQFEKDFHSAIQRKEEEKKTVREEINPDELLGGIKRDMRQNGNER